MKEELINKFSEKILQYASNIEQFTSNEVPKYINELLEYRSMVHITDAIVPVFLLLSCALVLVMIVFWAIKNRKEDMADDLTSFLEIVSVGITLLIAAGALDSLKDDLMKVYQIKNAPRVYIIDYLKWEK